MKIKLIVCALVLAALMILPAFAASATKGEHWSNAVIAEAAYGTPAIDGKISSGEWDAAKVISISLDDPIVNKYGIYQGGWEKEKKASDFSTEVRILWDDTALYIYEKRMDDEVVTTGSSNEPWNKGDGNLIFLQVGDMDSGFNAAGYSHHIFYIVADNNGKIGGASSVRVNNEQAKAQRTERYSEMEAKSALVSGGWIIEVKVPWSVFQKEVPQFKPEANCILGFSMVPIDHDDKGNDFSQLCWFKQDAQLKCSAGYDFGGWAELKLLAKPAATTKAAATTAAKAPATASAKTADVSVIVAAVAIVTLAGVVVLKKKH